MRKLKIGDKVKWNVAIGGDIVYTVRDISFNQPPTILQNGMVFPNEILFEFTDRNDNIIRVWGHQLSYINENISKGGITILNRDIEPYKEIKKFSFMN
jgi:hypothetical protein